MSRLASTPDGILVSLETINDYSLQPGRPAAAARARPEHRPVPVAPFHVVGTVQEFPSAPRDSFMVANLSYLTSSPTRGPTWSSPRPAAARRRWPRGSRRRPASLGTEVKNIDQQTAQTVTSITTVDLTGISHLEEVFAIVLVAAATGDLRARRRGGAAARVRDDDRDRRPAAGGRRLRLERGRRWSWSPAALLAAGLGWLLAQMLVAMLTHVFDPPPDHLAMPWGFLGLLYGVALLAGIARLAPVAQRALGRLPLGRVLRER